MILNKKQVRDLYQKRARHYDRAMWSYWLAGARVLQYRRIAVNALSCKPGDTVVDLGCGTGLNLPLLERAVGREGRIIGVDLSGAMLDRARERVSSAGWRNVELVQADMAEYEFPSKTAGILATFAITIVPEYDEVIRKGAGAIRPGGRMAILELKRPARWPEWLIRFGAWLNKPFGVSLDYAQWRPRVSVRRHLKEVLYKEYYFGALYLSVGESPLSNE